MKKKKRFLGILLGMVLLLGLLPGMSLSALAYDGDPYADMVNTTTTVRFNDIDWYIIKDESTSAAKGTVTLFAKDPIGVSTFNGEPNNYSLSTVRNFLNGLTNSGGSFYSVARAIAPTSLTDVNVSDAKLWLLSSDEAREIENTNTDLLKCSQATGSEGPTYWLRSKSKSDQTADTNVAVVSSSTGVVNYLYGITPSLNIMGTTRHFTYGVRPALTLDLSKVDYDSETKTFSLKPEPAVVSKAPTAQNLTYDSSEHELVTAGQASGGTMQYALGLDEETEPDDSEYAEVIPTAADAATYFVWYKVFGDDTHSDSAAACLAVTIYPADSSGSAEGHEEGLTYTGEAQELVLAGTVQGGTMLYALGKDASTPPEDSLFAEEIPKGTDAGDYYVWYMVAGDANHNDVPPACLTVTINKAAIAPEVTITGWNYGESANAPEVNEEGNPGKGDVIYNYSEDADGEYTQTVPTEAGSYFVFAYVAETKNYKEGRTRPIGFAISRASIAITADDKSGTYGQNVKKLTYTVYGGYVDGDDLGVSVTSNVKKGSDVGDYPITVSWTENKNYYARLYDGTYTVREARMPVSASGYSGIYDGKAHGVTVDAPGDAKIYYAATELTADNYADAGSTSAITRTGIGTATVYYYVVKKNYEPAAGKGTITISRAPIDIASAGSGGQPAAKTGTYNGKSQKLLSAPGKLPDGCAKMQYRMSGKTSWSDSIPAAVKAGNYTVEYRYAGDKNHKNSAAFRIKATIAQAKITITAQDKSSPREASLKKLTWKVTGAYVSGDNLGIKASTAAKKTSKPGKYGISLSWNKNPNYTATLKKGVYTITDRITGTESARTKISMNAGFRVWWDGEDLKVSWGKARGAERYNILAAYCGKEEPKLVRTVSGNSQAVIKITMLDGKKADHTRNIKVKVIAYRKVNGQYTKMGWSIVAHVTGSRGRTSSYTNARRVTVQKDSFVLSTGKTAVVRAETVPEIQGKKLLGEDHTPGYRYASDNKKVATVDEKGKITAVGTGTCHIYIYAQNGTSKKVSVTVK